MTQAIDSVTRVAPPKKRSLASVIEAEKHRKRRRRWLMVALLLAIPLLAAASWVRFRPKPLPLAARFRATAVTEGDLVREVRATGRLEAVTTVQVGAEISGRIAAVEVDFNDHVKAGQILARFDRAALGAQLAQTQAALASARAQLEQAKTDKQRTGRDLDVAQQLFAKKIISTQERDNAQSGALLMDQRVSAAEAQVAAQLAAYQLAKTNLDHTVIRAPIDGIVITRNVDPGQTVASMLQTPVLFSVAADLRKMHAIATVDEADIGEVKEGQRAEFTVNAYPARIFTGLVTQVRSSPQIVQDVVTYGTEVEVDNFDLSLKPGMTASVRIRTASASHVLRVSALALRFTPPGEKPLTNTAVWVLADGAVRSIPVKTGVSDGETVELLPGAIAAGQLVLVELTPEGRKANAAGR